jgi:hypothetical protein
MRKLVLLSAIVMGSLGLNKASAQVRVHIGFNIGTPVVYREVPVYRQAVPVAYDDYYYLPDVEAYYSVPQHCYYYNDGYNWVSAAYLPGRYRNYDWQAARHYEIRSARPYLRHDFYRGRYGAPAGRMNWGGHYDGRYQGGYANHERFDHNGYGDRHFDGNQRFNKPNYDRSRNNWGGDHYRNNNHGSSNGDHSNHNNNNWGGNQRFADNNRSSDHGRPGRF